MKAGPSGVIHRIARAGVYHCGAKERDGERGVSFRRLVTCGRCRDIVDAATAAATAAAERPQERPRANGLATTRNPVVKRRSLARFTGN